MVFNNKCGAAVTSVSAKFLRVGQCRHLECIAARGGRLAMIDFPSMCGLIRHPAIGWILFDTGYAEHFFSETDKWPERLYRIALPIDLPYEQHLLQQLKSFGINADDITMVIVSHYHGDHIAGLKDFPNAKFIALKADTTEIQKLTSQPLRATLQGKLPGLLPENYFDRLINADDCTPIDLPDWMLPFTQGFDLVGDGSLIGIPLSGHSAGQLGLFLPDADGRPVFFVADACWSLPACREGRLPSPLTGFLTANNKTYKKVFRQLQQLANRENEIAILPSHCEQSWRQFQDE